ncbi:MAG: PhnD/SsuA/transferrin family substrate-binding protein [Deltaproteobacteria bacterium]|nr:PhnD/SsuA/transferrin family substrate-binding protein [Deltaproteobacteria bacterium]
MRHFSKIIMLAATVMFFLAVSTAFAGDIVLFYPPGYDAPQAKAIAETLSESSGLKIRPQIAKSYPDIIDAFKKPEPVLVYIGSFVQAMLYAQGLSIPLAQAVDGKELYSSIMIAPTTAGKDPVAIIKEAGAAVAYTKGASSGESGAKAATGGQANIPTNNHMAAANAVKVHKAKAAFVKNWWWEANKAKYDGLTGFEFPGVSDHRNPDNVLSANKAISPDDLTKIKTAAIKNAKVFGVNEFKEFSPTLLQPTLDLMKKAKIDPKTYTW